MELERMSIRGRRLRGLRWWAFGGALALIIGIFSSTLLATQAATAVDWPTYQLNNGRTGSTSETTINPSNAPNLKLHWTHTAAGSISTQPVEANSMIYWGSWDKGYEHATALNNNKVWSNPLGTTTDSSCNPVSVGVASTATVAPIKGRSMLFVGGGNARFYALDAKAGTIIWSTSLGSSPANFIWSSPAFYNGSVYIGLASFGDCPLVQGKVFQLDAAKGAVQHVFSIVKAGCTGGGVSGSPTIDQATGKLYFATGNSGACGTTEQHAFAIVELNASDMSFVDAWTVPSSEQVIDSDFVNTPTLFGNGLVGVANKNGKFYAFNRNSLHSGPIWPPAQVAIGGDCPQCGSGSISPAAWDGSTLYVAGGATSINGVSCKGSINALNPTDGSFIWRHCFSDGPVLGAVAMVPGVLVVGQGRDINVIAANSGNQFTWFRDSNAGSAFWSGASISNGVIYIGNMDGRLYAYGT